MPYYISIFDWSLYSTSLSQSELETSSHGNDPGQTGSNPYNPSVATWTGVDFTFNGGSSTLLAINDDDPDFEDGYVETGGTQTLAQDVTINGVDYFAGDEIQNEFSLIDAGGTELWVVRINGVNVGFAYPGGTPPTNGEVFNADDTRDGAAADSLDQTTPSSEAYQSILCFASGTMIATPAGPVPVEDLRPGAMVETLDRGPRRLLWVTTTRHSWAIDPDRAKPVLIRVGALGAGLPRRDLVVSAQHRVLVPDALQPAGLLVPACALDALPGIRRMRGKRRAVLVHLMFDRHEVVLAEGAPCESLFPGEMTLAALGAMARRQIQAIMGDRYPPARPFATAGAARKMLAARGMCWDAGALARAGVQADGATTAGHRAA